MGRLEKGSKWWGCWTHRSPLIIHLSFNASSHPKKLKLSSSPIPICPPHPTNAAAPKRIMPGVYLDLQTTGKSLSNSGSQTRGHNSNKDLRDVPESNRKQFSLLASLLLMGGKDRTTFSTFCIRWGVGADSQ